jgi:hypothetical protein
MRETTLNVSRRMAFLSCNGLSTRMDDNMIRAKKKFAVLANITMKRSIIETIVLGHRPHIFFRWTSRLSVHAQWDEARATSEARGSKFLPVDAHELITSSHQPSITNSTT